MQQQELRRWARDSAEADCPMILSPERRQEIGAAVLQLLSIADKVWEANSGRPLTDEEKYG